METSTTLSTQVYKRRGFAGRIAAGFNFLENNFRVLVRVSSIVAVPYAVSVALVQMFFRPQLPQMLQSGGAGWWQLGLQVLVCLLGGVCWSGLAYTIFQQYATRGYLPSGTCKEWAGLLPRNAWRMFLCILFELFVAAVFASILYMCYTWTVYLALFVLLVWVFCSIPMVLMPYFYMVDRMPLWFAFLESFRKGVPAWGSTFGLVVLCGLLCGVVVFIGDLPLALTQIVNHFATMGQLQGEAVDLPAYYRLLEGVLCALGIFIALLATLLFHAPLFYQYASLVAHEKNGTPD